MLRKILVSGSALLLLVLATAAGGEEPAVTTGAGAVIEGETASDPSVAVQRELSPLEQTIAAIRETAEVRVQALADRLALAPAGSDEALAIQAEMRQVKTGTEVAIVQAILADAREKGETDRITEAEQALDQMLHPEKYVVPAVPSERPAPSEN